MRSTFILFCVAGALAAGSVQAQEKCDRPAETIRAVQSPVDQLRGGEVLGRTAATCGNRWSAANLFEKANSKRPTVTSRFNLAAAYFNLGRYEEAAELYRSTAVDGQYTDVVLDPVFGGSFIRPRTVNIADESNRRLARVSARLATRADAAQPFTAAQAGVNASERQPSAQAGRSVSPAGAVSDAEALARDGLVSAKIES